MSVHPLLRCGDDELAAAFERLIADESASRVLTDWEFHLAADAAWVYSRWGGFTWRQRRALRGIVRKLVTP